MTDLDATFSPATATTAAPADMPAAGPAPLLPKRPGLWRVVSIAAVATAVVVSTISVLQARNASDLPVPDRPAVALETARVTVADLPVPAAAEIAVLGLAHDASRRALDTEGSDIDLPRGMTALVALYDGTGAIVGMALAPGGQDRQLVQISAQSTAQALLTLSPGILRPNLSEAVAIVGVIEQDPAFAELVDTIRANPVLTAPNPQLESAYAAIADRIPAEDPPPDQGCDSVLDPRAYASAGSCVQPEPTGVLITNEQDRWALIYAGGDAWPDLCAVVAPSGTAGSVVLVPHEQCTGSALMVAPGPLPDQGDDQDVVVERIRAAAAVQALYDYAGPFADLAGGSAGFAESSAGHLRQNAGEVEGSLALAIARDEALAEAMDVTVTASTALDRHLAAVTAARVIIEQADITNLIPQRTIGDTHHVALLDFYERAGEYMVASRTAWRWESEAVGTVNFGEDT